MFRKLFTNEAQVVCSKEFICTDKHISTIEEKLIDSMYKFVLHINKPDGIP